IAVGRSSHPKSLWNNPHLYPQMFPWLFPYGLGSWSESVHKHRMSTVMYKQWLLMYYDKHFQLDEQFALVAFNHEQIRSAMSAGYLLTSQNSFNNITNHLLNLDSSVL
ncbi:hypothetical protein BDN67DRAFT_870015, partial [Paxillus ammoniavirescens]